MQIALVMLGGFFGAGCRFLIGNGMQTDSGFPWGTFSINLIGCFLLGLLLPILKRRYSNLFYFIGTGFVGSFTTFSTFSVQTVKLFNHNQYGIGLTYVGVSIFLGIGLAIIGFKLGLTFQERQGKEG